MCIRDSYEPFESPVVNIVAPKIQGNPVARVFQNDRLQFGDAKEFPYAATSYRLTEHFHFWTKHVRFNAVMQPEFFVEISEQLASEKGIKSGHWAVSYTHLDVYKRQPPRRYEIRYRHLDILLRRTASERQADRTERLAMRNAKSCQDG